MNTKKIKKTILLNLPYFLVGGFATNLGEAWRIASGNNVSEKVQGLVLYGGFSRAFENILPSIHPFDLVVGITAGVALRIAVYLKSWRNFSMRRGTA